MTKEDGAHYASIMRVVAKLKQTLPAHCLPSSKNEFTVNDKNEVVCARCQYAYIYQVPKKKIKGWAAQVPDHFKREHKYAECPDTSTILSMWTEAREMARARAEKNTN